MRPRAAAAGAALLALCAGCGRPALPQVKTAKLSAPDPLPAQTACYRLVPSESKLKINISTMVGDYTLRFSRYQSEVKTAPADPTRSRLWLQLDTRSLSANSKLVARAARSRAFLDVARFPHACFVTQHVTRDPERPQGYDVQGALSLHGVTRGVVLPVRIARSGSRYVVFSHFLLDRRLFNIRAPGMLDAMVDKRVAVRLQLVAEDCPTTGTLSRWWRGCDARAADPNSPAQETK